MTGKTHREGGMLCAMVGFALLEHNNLLLPDVNELLQLAVMYPFCMWGSVASDLDHHWESCPSKDIPSWTINKALHITAPMQKSLEAVGDTKSGLYKFAKFFNAKHRSWQTHSDLTLYVLIGLLYLIFTGRFVLGTYDVAIASLILTGITMGVIAHFILDMLTPEGIYIVGLVALKKLFRLKRLPEKIHFVPKCKLFATGGKWEIFIQKLLRILTVLATLYIIFGVVWTDWVQYIPYEISLGG